MQLNDPTAMSVKEAIMQHMASFQNVEHLRSAVEIWLKNSDGSLSALDQALVDYTQDPEARHQEWLRRELEAGERSGFEPFTWDDVEADSDKMLANGTLDRNSAALPL